MNDLKTVLFVCFLFKTLEPKRYKWQFVTSLFAIMRHEFKSLRLEMASSRRVSQFSEADRIPNRK